MATAAPTTIIPSWLEDNCFRLSEPDSDITNLNLNLRRLTPATMCTLVKALQRNNRIQIINLTSSLSMNHPDQALLPLSDILRHHSSIQKIHLSYNRLVNGVSLGEVLRSNTQLLELYLDYNLLDSPSAIALAKGLSQNQTLRVLQLNCNRIGDVGGQALGLALRENKTLQTLGLRRNHLGELSGRALTYALERNVTLTKLQLGENPLLQKFANLLTHMVHANHAGRHLLRVHDEHMPSLWSLVLQGLEPDMILFFLKEKPELVP